MRDHLHEPLPDEQVERWKVFGRWPGRTLFPSVLGVEVDDVRQDYCRMRLPYRPELEQPSRLVHGGALASLVDCVVVPAIGQAYDGTDTDYATVTMNLNYLRAVRGEDAIAEGWVTKRGRSMVFCQAVVWTTDPAKPVIEASLVYALIQPRS